MESVEFASVKAPSAFRFGQDVLRRGLERLLTPGRRIQSHQKGCVGLYTRPTGWFGRARRAYVEIACHRMKTLHFVTRLSLTSFRRNVQK